ncbi:MAG TPA: hypothetical protein VL381_08080, partial [Rhodocyclaceae bacterium]|nr:hypothetical protein [Rhodocyclaceae bacterium]
MKTNLRTIFLFGMAVGLATPYVAAAGFDSASQCRSVSAETCATAKALGRGINMGNMLEAPREGDWGVRL